MLSVFSTAHRNIPGPEMAEGAFSQLKTKPAFLAEGEQLMKEFEQREMNRELMFLIWESLDKETYRELTKLLRNALSSREHTCLGCGSVLSPKLLEVEFDEKAEQENVQ